MAYSAVNLNTELNKINGKLIIKEHPKMFPVFSMFQESSYSLFESVVVERGTEETQSIFETLVFNSKLKSLSSANKLKAVKNTFDINPLIRVYGVDEKIPTWFLNGYMKEKGIIAMRRQMLKKMVTL